MTKFGERLIKSAEETLSHARGEHVPGMRVHTPPPVDVRAVPRKTGLSQAKFAAKFGFSPGAGRNWEQGRRTPEGPARTLLLVIGRWPEVVLEALNDTA